MTQALLLKGWNLTLDSSQVYLQLWVYSGNDWLKHWSMLCVSTCGPCGEAPHSLTLTAHQMMLCTCSGLMPVRGWTLAFKAGGRMLRAEKGKCEMSWCSWSEVCPLWEQLWQTVSAGTLILYMRNFDVPIISGRNLFPCIHLQIVSYYSLNRKWPLIR